MQAFRFDIKRSLMGALPTGPRNPFKTRLILLAGLFVAILLAQPLGAQQTAAVTGGLNGIVTDSTGAVV